MPIFDFKCNNCGNVQEVLTTGASQEPVFVCDKCKAEQGTKLLSGGMHFKLLGEGWASDGYAYEYTKTKAGTEDKVKPAYSRKKVEETVKKYYENTFEPLKQEKI